MPLHYPPAKKHGTCAGIPARPCFCFPFPLSFWHPKVRFYVSLGGRALWSGRHPEKKPHAFISGTGPNWIESQFGVSLLGGTTRCRSTAVFGKLFSVEAVLHHFPHGLWWANRTGLLKSRYILQPFETCCFFNTKIKRNHHLQVAMFV